MMQLKKTCQKIAPILATAVTFSANSHGVVLRDEYQERDVVLDYLAYDIVRSFDGTRSLWDIAGSIVQEYEAEQLVIAKDVFGVYRMLNSIQIAFDYNNFGFFCCQLYHYNLSRVFHKYRWV